MPQQARTMVEAVFPRATLARDVLLVVSFAVLTALSAQAAVWAGPVPLSAQTFAVVLSGALLGSKRGALSQVTYIGMGAVGAPVFAGWHGGIAHLMGPTGGYLAGFVAAAFVVGLLAERGWDRRVLTTAAAMFAGNVVIYVFGLAWLAYFMPKGTVLSAGLYPFIPGDIIKTVLAAVALPSGWALLRRFTM